MENTGLADVWVEAGAFAEGSADAMMESKAYYRAVQRHMLTYEALQQIYWSFLVHGATKLEKLLIYQPR